MEKPSGKKTKKTFIALELAEGGEMFDYLCETGAYDDNTCRTYFTQLVHALKYCHESGFAHRDLKPENLLYDIKFQLKISDFGFSTCIESGEAGKLYTVLGTESYMAPEIHEEKAYDGASVDLFAAGIILFIMKSGHPPFGSATKSDNYYKAFMKKPKKFWKVHSKNHEKGFYSKEFKDLVTGMLQYDSSKRFNIE
jgi:serine/threonine protein kinase